MKVFSLLLSIFLFPSSVQPQSQWGDWGSWSSCSRTCGGGITFQERKCLTKDCVGENKIHRSCNIQDCPNGGNFRQEQCAAYNSLPWHGKFYAWFPYSGVSDNPCSLSCMPKNEYFYDTFKEKVIDGTRCNDDNYNMCADGVCKKAGCDLILGSDAKEDKCRVCNGGGNNCRTIQNIYTGNKKGIGYVDILSIPSGATNIFIKEVIRSSNYLALKNSHSFILNGNRNIKRSHKYKEHGIIMKYKRSKKEESIFVLGPTTDILYLSLLSMGGDISISYEYSVPKSQKTTDKLIKYSWKTEQYGECNRKCNGGEKSRKVYCVRSHDNVEVEDDKCSTPLKPKETKICNEQSCSPRWFIGAWSPCSLSCGEGTQVRRVHCERETPEGIEMIDEKRYCTGDKAITQRKCIVFEECPKWALREWSECSKTCGGGIRTRTVQCVETNNNVIGNDKCPEHNKPRNQEICNENPCDVRWVSSDWGACRPSCGKGMRTRQVYCANSIEIERRYPDFMCENTIAKPETTKPCSSSKSCPPMWYGSSWSKCTTDCGKGMQMRNVFCGLKEKGRDYLKILSYDRCRYLPQLKTIQVCKIKPCHSQWIVSSWKPCSSKCGNGRRLRDVRCFADSEEDKTEKSCDAKKKPLTEDICNLIECPSGSKSIPLVTTDNPTRSPAITRSLSRTLESTRKPSQSATTTATTRTLRVRTTTTTEITRKTTVLTKLIFPTRGTVENSIEGTSMPAMIVRGPVNDEAVVGSDITLACEAKGNPKPNMFWLKGNLDVSVFGQRFQVLPNGYLKIIAVQEVDEDVYTCVANNVISRRSQPAYLLVTTVPYVDMTLGYTVKEGEVANIQCRASGKPRPTIEWYKDGNILKVQRSDRMVVTTQAITIMSVQLSDHGKYECKATNKNGETPGYMMLDVLPDEKTRLHDIMNGNCKDIGELENCEMAAKLENPTYCDKPYYQMVCCKTCRGKHKGRLGRL